VNLCVIFFVFNKKFTRRNTEVTQSYTEKQKSKREEMAGRIRDVLERR
jgi:hypothetical protein